MHTGIVSLPVHPVMSLPMSSRCGVSEVQFNKLLQCKGFCSVRARISSLHRCLPINVIAPSKRALAASSAGIACAGLLGAFYSTSAVGWTPTRARTGPYCCRLGCSMIAVDSQFPAQEWCWSDMCLVQRFAELRAGFPDFLDVDEPSFMAAISDIRVCDLKSSCSAF